MKVTITVKNELGLFTGDYPWNPSCGSQEQMDKIVKSIRTPDGSLSLMSTNQMQVIYIPKDLLNRSVVIFKVENGEIK